jgi:hypothetical protein
MLDVSIIHGQRLTQELIHQHAIDVSLDRIAMHFASLPV